VLIQCQPRSFQKNDNYFWITTITTVIIVFSEVGNIMFILGLQNFRYCFSFKAFVLIVEVQHKHNK